MLCIFFLILLSAVVCPNASAQNSKREEFFRKDYTYVENQSSFYKFHTIEKSWFEARSTCEREGATLFFANDDAEANDVLDFWRKSQPQTCAFVGISALIVKGVFETNDGQSVSSIYNKWRPGEPNNEAGNEDCVLMYRDDGSLTDDDCTKKQPFICKKTLDSLQWNSLCELPDPDYKFEANLNSCYKFHSIPLNWTEAYSVCNTEQAHLAIIESKAEADFLVNLTESAPKDISGNYLRGAVHLGFHRRDMDCWKTIKGKTLQDTGYAIWGNNQPDGGDDELCGSMFYTGQLNDVGCFQNMFFICEKELKGFNYDFRIGDLDK